MLFIDLHIYESARQDIGYSYWVPASVKLRCHIEEQIIVNYKGIKILIILTLTVVHYNKKVH